MRPGTSDDILRERVRKNVGRLGPAVVHQAGPITAGRYGLLFDGGDLTGGSAPGTPGAEAPGPVELPSLPQGRIYGVNLVILTGTRKVGVSPPLPAPCVIRAITLNGSIAVHELFSFRVLLTTDTDTTAAANPTGTDLIEFSGDAVGAEDPGCHAMLALGPLVVEPWRQILTSGQRIKLKAHNLEATSRHLALYLDIDSLTN